jgi:site-specific recombinase XerD
VKWLTPRAYRRWVDWGLRGLNLEGLDARVWRGRNAERDAAFAHLLYGTGLRLQEAGSLLIDELPTFDPNRRFYRCRLADMCAKRSHGRKFWMPRRVREELDQYISPEGERSRAVARAACGALR